MGKVSDGTLIGLHIYLRYELRFRSVRVRGTTIVEPIRNCNGSFSL
jgi:hypothetical protein